MLSLAFILDCLNYAFILICAGVFFGVGGWLYFRRKDLIEDMTLGGQVDD